MTSNNSESINYETLSSGDIVSKRSYVIDEKIVNDYLNFSRKPMISFTTN